MSRGIWTVAESLIYTLENIEVNLANLIIAFAGLPHIS